MLPDSDALPMATDEAALESLAFDPMAAPASRVDAVGTSTPVEDFDALLARGLADKAFEELQAVVLKLVDTSIAGRCAPALSSTQLCNALLCNEVVMSSWWWTLFGQFWQK